MQSQSRYSVSLFFSSIISEVSQTILQNLKLDSLDFTILLSLIANLLKYLFALHSQSLETIPWYMTYYLTDVVELSQTIYNNEMLKNDSEKVSAGACHAINRQLKDALSKSKGLEE